MSHTKHMQPDSQDWLTAQRIDFLTSKVDPISSLLQNSGLLDKVLFSWIDSEVISEVCANKSSFLYDHDKSSIDKQDDLSSDCDTTNSKIISWSKYHWGNKIETLYLQNKNRLDQLSCRLITVESSDFAYELYFRLLSEEDTFDNLVINYSIGKEKYQGGLFPRQSLDAFPKGLIPQLRSMKPGSLLKPFKYAKGFAILELKEWYHSTLDVSSEQQLLKWEYQSWKNYMVSELKTHLSIQPD